MLVDAAAAGVPAVTLAATAPAAAAAPEESATAGGGDAAGGTAEEPADAVPLFEAIEQGDDDLLQASAKRGLCPVGRAGDR